MKTASEVIPQGYCPWYLYGGTEQNNRGKKKKKPERMKSLSVNI
jgi:hypothetical protein